MNSKKEVDDLVFDILKKSRSLGVFPTPVDQIVKYCELVQNSGRIHIPANYIAKNIDAFRRMLGKIRGMLDREERSIYIDPNMPNVRQNFIKLHEVGHDTIPWQREIVYHDNEYTLSSGVKEEFEIEANYFASACLFQLDRFEDEMNKLPLEIGSAMSLAKLFGGSVHASLRRYTELSKKRCALIVLQKSNDKINSVLETKEYFQSKSFTKNFGMLSWSKEVEINQAIILDYCSKRRLHKDGLISIATMNGLDEFNYHYFDNNYNVFVLLIPKGERIATRATIHLTSIGVRS